MGKKEKRRRLFGSYASDVKNLLDILGDGGVHSSAELADELNRPRERIYAIVKKARDYFNKGRVDYRVWSTSGGYTTSEKAEHAMYEARKRLSMGMGVLLNGDYVFAKARMLAKKEFNALKITYQPKMLILGKFIK